MGTWGVEPWANDGAADWFGELLDGVALTERVEEALRLEPADHREEIRAAAALVIMLGRSKVWPDHELRRHLKLAISGLREVQDLPEIQRSKVMREAIADEIALLERRLESGADASAFRPSGWRKFW